MKKTILSSLAILCALSAMAQRSLSDMLRQQETERKQAVQSYLREHPEAKYEFTDEKGSFFLHHIDQNGKPVYYGSRNNLDLAGSIRTFKLWNNGGMGLNLQGQNMQVSPTQARIGMWEPSPTRTTHAEFGGRAVSRDTPLFTTHGISPRHAVHVATTLIGAGINPAARGMASQAMLDCYEIQNDEYDEILNAGQAGMLVSNHSYGPYYDSSLFTLGKYSPQCHIYDTIAQINRNYLMFFAGGNDRDDSAGVVWDILSGGAVAKNVATVAAVELLGPGGYTGPASVMMSFFSCYGPTDDGRIKPDFSAPGVDIFSGNSFSDTSYATLSGTSMASPGAAGSMFLLQQHYKNTTNSFMRSATLKGLGIHTADECGSHPGPDYMFGWGLLNLEKAVHVIDNSGSAHYMTESSLSNAATYTYNFNTTGGPLKATIAWTDIAARPNENPMNDRTPALINDLDLRIIDVATNQPIAALPWKLDYNNPANAATTGDNDVDNVEQIMVNNLPAGNYRVQVTHKGTLNGGAQEFSLFLSGINNPNSIAEFFVKDLTVKAYPNPVTDRLIIEGKNGINEVVITNAQGQVIATYQRNAASKLEVNAAAWASGIYQISIKTAEGKTESVSVVK